MPEKNRTEFNARHDTDVAYAIPGLTRFRANVFADRKGLGAVFRVIPAKILTAEQLGLSSYILQLCQLSKGRGRVAALEVLMVTGAISNLIREGKTFQLPSMMQVGKAFGLVSLNEALIDLVTRKLVEPDEAYSKAVDKGSFEAALKRAGLDPRPKPQPALA